MRTIARLREYVATTRSGIDIVPLDPAELRELLDAAEERDRLLGLGTGFPLVDVLRKLREAAGILLDDKDYDGHGWEQLQAARDAASGYIAVASPPEKQS